MRFNLGIEDQCDLRVGASVGHGQETSLAVLDVEVLIGELVTIDGFTTSALSQKIWVRIEYQESTHEKYSRCHG